MANINVTFVEQGQPVEVAFGESGVPVVIAFPLTATFAAGSASRDPEFDSITLTGPGGVKWKISVVGKIGSAPDLKAEEIA